MRSAAVGEGVRENYCSVTIAVDLKPCLSGKEGQSVRQWAIVSYWKQLRANIDSIVTDN